MRKNVFWIVCLLLLITSVSSAMDNDEIEVVAEGCGKSIKTALLDAKRAAIEQGIGTVLVSQTEIENFMLKKDIVLTKTRGAVHRYEQLGSRKDEFGQCVTIRALVSLADIREDLAALRILLESMERPRMMVLIQGKNSKAVETEIIDYLSSKEFDLVDPSMVATLQKQSVDLVRQAVAGDPVAAAKIGVDNGAEYILIGSVSGGLQKNDLLAGSGMFSAQAHISARVINCSNSRIVASKNARSAMAHISEDAALQGAVLKTAQKLMDVQLFEAIITSFQDLVNNGQTLDVTVRGLKNYHQQKQVSSVMSALDAVQSVNKRSFSAQELKLTVMFQGSVDSFCDEVDGQKSGDKTMAVTGVVGNRIVVILK